MTKLIFTNIAMLIAAFFQMPYGYYQLLKFVIFITTGVIGFDLYNKTQTISYKFIAYSLIALLYNPFINIHFERENWQIINIITIIMLFFYIKDENSKSSI
ncbi:MAG: DUF6804 family protein [bacterium]